MSLTARLGTGPVIAAVPWAALAGATVFGTVLAALVGDGGRTVDVLRWGALALAMALAGVVDDPAAELRASLPVPDRRLRLLAVVAAAPALALAWALLVRVSTSRLLLGDGADAAVACVALVRGPLLLEGTAITALLLGVAAGARRRSGTGGAIAAGAGGILLYLGLQLLPHRVALSAGPLDAAWQPTHLRWGLVLVLGAAVAVHLLGDRWRRPSARRMLAGGVVTAIILGLGAGTVDDPDVATTFDRVVAGQGLLAAEVITGGGPLRHGAALGEVALLEVVVIGEDQVARAHLPVEGAIAAADLHAWARTLPAATDGEALALVLAAGPPPGLVPRDPQQPAAGSAVAEVVTGTHAGSGTVASVAQPGPDTCGVAVAGAVHASRR